MPVDDIYSYPLLGWLRTLVFSVVTLVTVPYAVVMAVSSSRFVDHFLNRHELFATGFVLWVMGSALSLAIFVGIFDRRLQNAKRAEILASYTTPARARALRRRRA